MSLMKSGKVDTPAGEYEVEGPLSRKALLSNTDAAPNDPFKVYFFHAHIYFDDKDDEGKQTAREFFARINATFSAQDGVKVHGTNHDSIGLHPKAEAEVLFCRSIFTDFLLWLSFARPESISILIHPITGDSAVADHDQRAIWLGKPLELGTHILAFADKNLAAATKGDALKGIWFISSTRSAENDALLKEE